MKVMAHDTAITLAAASGQLELNAFMPLMADSLIDALVLLREAVDRLCSLCVETLEADAAACARHLHASTAPALLLVPLLGYEAAATLAKDCLHTGKSIRQLVEEKQLLPMEQIDRLFSGVRL